MPSCLQQQIYIVTVFITQLFILTLIACFDYAAYVV